MKKGQIWVSAALYFGLGIIVLTIILTAGMPVINKLRDKNTVIQTKEVMNIMDNNIREVIRGGPGSQRVIEVEIKKGNFVINEDSETINWSMESRALLSQPGETIEEGNLNIVTEETNVKDKYNVKIGIDYSHVMKDENGEGLIDLEYGPANNVISGMNELVIKNTGKQDGKIKITIDSL